LGAPPEHGGARGEQSVSFEAMARQRPKLVLKQDRVPPADIPRAIHASHDNDRTSLPAMHQGT
jgi:hypothetical protein